MKKNLFYITVAALCLMALGICRDCVVDRLVLAQLPDAPVKGDLVIDFMGAQRGYVEPCG